MRSMYLREATDHQKCNIICADRMQYGEKTPRERAKMVGDGGSVGDALRTG